MVSQAARDIANGHRSIAWDGAEFLAVTGVWLCHALFRVPPQQTRKELVRLMKHSRTLRDKVNSFGQIAETT